MTVDNETFIAVAKKHLNLKAINTAEKDLPDLPAGRGVSHVQSNTRNNPGSRIRQG